MDIICSVSVFGQYMIIVNSAQIASDMLQAKAYFDRPSPSSVYFVLATTDPCPCVQDLWWPVNWIGGISQLGCLPTTTETTAYLCGRCCHRAKYEACGRCHQRSQSIRPRVLGQLCIHPDGLHIPCYKPWFNAGNTWTETPEVSRSRDTHDSAQARWDWSIP